MGQNFNKLNQRDVHLICGISKHNYDINGAQIEKLYSSGVDVHIELYF